MTGLCNHVMVKKSVPIVQSLSCIRRRAYIRARELQGWLKLVPPVA